jgi:hypothetical protein
VPRGTSRVVEHDVDVQVWTEYLPGGEVTVAHAVCGCGWESERGDESDVRDAAHMHVVDSARQTAGGGRYRYEATITVVLAADGIDEAYRMQQQIAGIIEDHTNERVEQVQASMLGLKHRPDLDGSLRV